MPRHLLRKKSLTFATETRLLVQLLAGKYKSIKSVTMIVAVLHYVTYCVRLLKATRFIFLFRS